MIRAPSTLRSTARPPSPRETPGSDDHVTRGGGCARRSLFGHCGTLRLRAERGCRKEMREGGVLGIHPPPSEPTACGVRVCAFKLPCAPPQTLFLPTYLTFSQFFFMLRARNATKLVSTELLRRFGWPLFVCVRKLEAKVNSPSPPLPHPLPFFYRLFCQ